MNINFVRFFGDEWARRLVGLVREYALMVGVIGAAFAGGYWYRHPAVGRADQFDRCGCQGCMCRCHIRHDELLPDGHDNWDDLYNGLDKRRPDGSRVRGLKWID